MSGEFFDPLLPAKLIEGNFRSVKVNEPGNFGLSNLIVDPTKEFTIEATWEFKGPLTKLWLAALADDWVVTAYAESVGTGPDRLLKQRPLAVASAAVDPNDPNHRTWTAKLVVPAGSLPEENPGVADPSGVYELVVTAFLNSTLGEPGYDIIGFGRGPTIKAESPN